MGDRTEEVEVIFTGGGHSASAARALTVRRVPNRDLCCLLSFFDQPQRHFLAFASQKLVFLALQVVIVHKKFLQLGKPLFRKILQLSDVGIPMVRFGYGDKPVVADFVRALELLPFNDPDKARFDGASWKRWFIHEKQNVDGIAIRS